MWLCTVVGCTDGGNDHQAEEACPTRGFLETGVMEVSRDTQGSPRWLGGGEARSGQSVRTCRGGGGVCGLWFTNLGEGPSLHGQQGPVSTCRNTENKDVVNTQQLTLLQQNMGIPFLLCCPQTPSVVTLVFEACVMIWVKPYLLSSLAYCDRFMMLGAFHVPAGQWGTVPS